MTKKPYLSKFINAREALLTIKGPFQEEIFENKPYALLVKSNNKISLGEDIGLTIKGESFTFETTYKINKLTKKNNDDYIVTEFQSNLSSKYILPLLGVKKDDIEIQENFINCYVNHYDFKHNLGKYIYLVYRYFPAPHYNLLTEGLKGNKYFNDTVKDKDERFDVFMFKMSEYSKDILLLLEGKYSHISDKAKKLIIAYHKDDELVSGVLNKTEELRLELGEKLGCNIPEDIDLEEMPKLINETWNYSK